MPRAATARAQSTATEPAADARRVGDLTVAEFEHVIERMVARQLGDWADYLIDELSEIVSPDPDRFREGFEEELAKAIQQADAGETVSLDAIESPRRR